MLQVKKIIVQDKFRVNKNDNVLILIIFFQFICYINTIIYYSLKIQILPRSTNFGQGKQLIKPLYFEIKLRNCLKFELNL